MYSKKTIDLLSFGFMKIKGVLALYRLRSIIDNVGKNSRCPLSVEIKVPEKIKIGNFVSIGPMTTIGGFGGVIIENYVRISKGVTIESASLVLEGSLPYKHKGAQIIIKEGAWLGARCIILGGVTIGRQAVIGAGAIISKDVKDFDVVVSQPSRSIGMIRNNV